MCNSPLLMQTHTMRLHILGGLFTMYVGIRVRHLARLWTAAASGLFLLSTGEASRGESVIDTPSRLV